MTTLLKDLLKIHDQSLQEKDVQPSADDDMMTQADDDMMTQADDDADVKSDEGDDASSEFTICMNESLFMRILEHTREEVKNDIELHKMVDAIEDLMKDNKRLTMDHYADIVGDEEKVPVVADKDADKDSDADEDDAGAAKQEEE